MTPERWQQIEQVYHAALERADGQRASYLQQACAGDDDLRREVESLLDQKSSTGALLKNPRLEGAGKLLEASTLTQLSAGEQLGPYKIEARIGAGGMGEVFRAMDTRLRRTVAIKILPHSRFVDPDRKRRFLQEARAASALNHPNIIILHDIANENGMDYLVMEYVAGKSLDKLISTKGLPLPDAIDYTAQIAGALAAAHAAGIVHRDVKPANAIVTSDSQVKVLDFGLAKLMERASPIDEAETREPTLTEIGAVMGTVAYMSPEQASGRQTDHRTDIFSLGVVLYEMLAGNTPFHGKSHVETMHAIINDSVPPLAQPPELGEIVARAVAKDPKDRYQHAGDLALDLRRFERAWKAKTLASMRDTPALVQRRWLGWSVIASIAALLIAGIATMRMIAPRANAWVNPLENAQFTRFTDFEGAETDAAISRDGKFVAFRSDRDGPVDTWVSQVGTGRFVNLTHGMQNTVLIRNTGFTPDGSEIWLAGIIGGTRLRLIPLTGGTARAFLTEHAINPAWSPDGSRIVFHTYDTGDPMFVCDSTGANPQQLFKLGPGGHNHFPTWSVDGQWIYFVSGMWEAREMDIWRMRSSGGTPERLTQHNSDIRYVTPLDRQTLLYVAPDESGSGPWLWALDIERKVSRRISSGLDIFSSVEANADGHRLVVTASNPTAKLWTVPLLDRQTQERDVKPFDLPTVRAFAPRYGRNSLFYLSSRSGGDGLWRYEDGQATEIWRGADGALLEPVAVSFDSRHLAVILRKQGKRTLNTISAEGGDVRPLAETIDVSSAAAWSPDGKWIVAGGIDGNGPGLFKIPVDGGEPVRLAKDVVSNPVWSPDGSVIVYTGPVVGVTGPLLMIRPDGTPVEAPSIRVRVGGERYRFVPGRQELVYIPGSQVSNENFWMLDLATKKARQLSDFDTRAIRTFDISPDGKQVVFDRLRDNSNIVMIDLPKKVE